MTDQRGKRLQVGDPVIWWKGDVRTRQTVNEVLADSQYLLVDTAGAPAGSADGDELQYFGPNELSQYDELAGEDERVGAYAIAHWRESHPEQAEDIDDAIDNLVFAIDSLVSRMAGECVEAAVYEEVIAQLHEAQTAATMNMGHVDE
jgi:hypothetical protein